MRLLMPLRPLRLMKLRPMKPMRLAEANEADGAALGCIFLFSGIYFLGPKNRS